MSVPNKTYFREQPVMEYLQKSKCRCGHLYDYYHEGKPDEIYIKPPTEHGPFTIDKSKIYQMDPMEDFIKDTVRDAVKSADDSVNYHIVVNYINSYLRYLYIPSLRVLRLRRGT